MQFFQRRPTDGLSRGSGFNFYFYFVLPVSRQTRVCRDKTRAKNNSRQPFFCRDKHVFVATIHVFWREKSMLIVKKSLVSTKTCLSGQNIFCRDKCFVATSNLLSKQRTCFVATTRVCRDKTFVATKMILVATPASDTG